MGYKFIFCAQKSGQQHQYLHDHGQVQKHKTNTKESETKQPVQNECNEDCDIFQQNEYEVTHFDSFK